MRSFALGLFLSVALLSHLATSANTTKDIYHDLFHFDPQLGWAPTADQTAWVEGTRKFFVHSNPQGFRDIDHAPATKPGVLFLGDSFTWGFDVSQDEIFTEKLRPLLPQYEIWNEGVTAYGNDQEWLLLQKTFAEITPAAVVLVFCTENDRRDNQASQHGKYGKPFFELAAGGLILRNSPVPHYDHAEILAGPQMDPTHAIVTEMKQFLRARGTRFIVALTAPDEMLTDFLQDEAIPFVVLDNVSRQSGQGDHWSAAGHADVANRLARQLILTIS